MIAGLLYLMLLLTSSDAGADIYRYRNGEGIECFTDAPTSRSAVKIMKEPDASRNHTSGKKRSAVRRAETGAKSDTGGLNADQGPGTLSKLLPVRGTISSPVGLRHDPIDGILRDHKGVDIATPPGTPVRPVAPGTVTFSGYRTGYGNTVIVRHDDGMVTLYAHNSANLKAAGDPVDRGSTIAFSGSTGRTTGPHLHFEAWKDNVNMTSSFVPGAAVHYEVAREKKTFRRIVQGDGTLMFTNMP